MSQCRISNLSDDLLHVILLKLLSTTAAGRTSVLSRRWRHVWASLPDLLLENINAADSVDAALAACSAPTATRLAITMPLLFPNDLTTARVNPWLRFAAERRLAGELTLRLPRTVDAEGEITLPLLEKVTRITLTISSSTLRVLPTGGGTFASLTVARITGARMASRDIKRFGSARCPCLRTLELRGVSLVTGSEVSIRSESLERLVLHVRIAGGRLELVTPRLQYLRAPARCSMLLQATVVAPKLADLGWHVDYRREHHRFVEAGTHLRRLVITGKGGSMVPLLRRFHTVDELVLKSGDRQVSRSLLCVS
ncbi:hypothetical protein QOZ80_2AG0111000 [Eleusine coracana subsp. coracana]|nr:hypothetical protein QOZ80_2AG0111000 [Eleusine coracana subsp. coracana]